LLGIVLSDLKEKGEIFDIPEKLFYKHWHYYSLYTEKYGQRIHNPIGLSAGSHTQLAQNIITGWLCGARFIDLKTVQPNAVNERAKPSIDIFNGAFNSELSQELSIENAFDQYLNAWIIIHIIDHELFNKTNKYKDIGTVFNMGLAYTLADIRHEKMQWFIDKMINCSEEKNEKINRIKKIYPGINNINIPDQISQSFTITTCKGCSARELEYICKLLVIDKKLHPNVKLSPSLLGYKSVQAILNNENTHDVQVAEDDFEDTIQYGEAITLIENLLGIAGEMKKQLTVKISNSLTCKNTSSQIPGADTRVYLSGKALHPIAVNLAAKIQTKFEGQLDLAFAGGANCFNISNLLQSGFSSIGVTTDLLKPGGYGRLNQYFTELSRIFANYQAKNIREFILKSGNEYGVKESALENLRNYAMRTLSDPACQKDVFSGRKYKSERPLLHYDCIKAPCTEASPLGIKPADYCWFTLKNDPQKAINSILIDNPLPSILGMADDDPSRYTCMRAGYDYPVLMKEVERFISEFEPGDLEGLKKLPSNNYEVAVIGGGMSGLACAWFLNRYGFAVDVYEAETMVGGMISKMVPGFRITNDAINKDIERLKKAGIKFYNNTTIDKERFERIRQTYSFVYVATGAAKINLPKISNDVTEGLIDVATFLTKAKEDKDYKPGGAVAVIGNDWMAADAARAAIRLVGQEGYVALIIPGSRRDINVDPSIQEAIIDEEIEIFDYCRVKNYNILDGKIDSLELINTREAKADKAKKLKYEDIEGSEQTYKFDVIIHGGERVASTGFVDIRKLKIDGDSHQTKLDGVFVGGAVTDPNISIMAAIADAKSTALEIAEQAGIEIQAKHFIQTKSADLDQIKIKRCQVEKANFPESLAPEARTDFSPVVSTFKPLKALKEAGRCLQCDALCNVCVTVCPNRAMLPFEVNLKDIKIPVVALGHDTFSVGYPNSLPITQKHQVLNIADWCNNCGNCTTFCPSTGSPYQDKIRLHFSHETFNQDAEGLLLTRNGKYHDLTLKRGGNLAMLTENWDALIFENDHCMAVLDKGTFRIAQITVFDDSIETLEIPEITEMKMFLKVLKDFV